MRTLIAAATILVFTLTNAQAETFPVITDKTVLTECSDCHMAFPPETLPKAAWQKIIGNLSDHFGEDASLDDATVATVLSYHVKHASDVSNVRAAKKWRTSSNVTRIIDAPRFIKKHRKCPDAVWNHKLVRSKANCIACHQTMQTNGSTKANVSFLPADLARVCDDD